MSVATTRDPAIVTLHKSFDSATCAVISGIDFTQNDYTQYWWDKFYLSFVSSFISTVRAS